MLDLKQNSKKNICLIGLMGSGKSIIGKELATAYKLKFYDTDLEIEREVGKTIKNIFLDHGEIYFRKIEENVCLKILEFEDCIISLGGGSIVNPKIRKLMEKNAFSIYLKVDIKVLSERLKNTKKRPLLNNVNKTEKLNKLYNERKNYYNRSNITIENNFNKKEVIKEIKKKLLLNE